MSRRLDRLQGSLGPREATLHWLAEAHAFGSLPAYVAWLADQPEVVHPLAGLPDRVDNAVRRSLWGRPQRVVEAATRGAVSDACFLVLLVITINGTVAEVARYAGIRAAALVWWMRALAPGRQAIVDRTGWPGWTEAACHHLVELRVLETARAQAEARYLKGRTCLFPELEAEWLALIEHADGLARVGEKLAASEIASGVGRQGLDPAEVDARLQELVVRARIDTLDLLGDGDGATRLAKRELKVQRWGAP